MRKLFNLIWIICCLFCIACSDDKIDSKFELSTGTLAFYSGGGENIISITTGGAWTASSDADWCMLVQTSGEGAGVLKVMVSENTTGTNREANVSVSAGGQTLTVKVTQYRQGQVSLSRPVLKLTSDACSDTLTLVTNGKWTVDTKVDWVHVTPGSGDAGTSVLNFTVDKNEGTTDRVAEVVFSIPDAGTTVVWNILQYNVNGSPQLRDSLALVKFYSLLDDPKQLTFNIWNPAKPFSSWYGVETKVIGDYTRVVKLNGASIVNKISYTPWQRGTTLPEEIGWLDELTELNLSNMVIAGEIPASFGNLVKLKALYLSCNELNGALPAELKSLTQLQVLDLGGNELAGDIPEYIGTFKELKVLKLGYNAFERIPDCFGNLTKLDSLEMCSLFKLTANGEVDSSALRDLNRTFPKSLLSLSNLKRLDIHACYFTGSLPEEIGNMSGTLYLMAYNNCFSGTLPASFSRMTNLVTLNLSNNQLSGSIPVGVGECKWLYNLILSDNRFSGGIPKELKNCTYLQTLDLRNNQFSGNLPAELFDNGSHYYYIDISRNQLGGDLPGSLGNQRELTEFIAGHNQFTSIPVDISGALSLGVLALNDNLLTEIPTEISYLARVSILDLKNNNITGNIPDFLSKLRNLSLLGLAGNRLTGNVPQWIIDYSSNNLPLDSRLEICPQQNGVTLGNCPGDSPVVTAGGGQGKDDMDSGMGI